MLTTCAPSEREQKARTWLATEATLAKYPRFISGDLQRTCAEEVHESVVDVTKLNLNLLLLTSLLVLSVLFDPILHSSILHLSLISSAMGDKEIKVFIVV